MRRAILGALLWAAGCNDGAVEMTACVNADGAAAAFCPSGYIASCPDEPLAECRDDTPHLADFYPPLCEDVGDEPSCLEGRPKCVPLEDVAERCGGTAPACPSGDGESDPVCPPGHEPACFGPGSPLTVVRCGLNADTESVQCNVDGDPFCAETYQSHWRPVTCVPCD